MTASAAKTAAGRFFEDFRLGETIRHATPRTLTSGDASLYSALYGSRFAPQSAETFARAIGYPASPIDDLLAFHVVFGKTVPDVSLNAVANLGYADCRFLEARLSGRHAVGGLGGHRAQGKLEQAERRRLCALARVQPARRDGDRICPLGDGEKARSRRAPRPRPHVPEAPRGGRRRATSARPARRSTAPRSTTRSAARRYRFEDYPAGERIDHVDGVTVEEAEHMIATRLYQNTAKVHFNQLSEGQGRFGRRLDLWRPCHFARPRAELQRPRQRLPYRGDQRRPACRAALRRRHGVRLERGGRDGGAAGPRRRRGA